MLPSLDSPLYPDYVMRFGAEVKALTERFVPPRGPSGALQGELVRAVDKLWYEGQDNGNINWGRDFEIFCDLLTTHLLAQGVLDEPDRSMAEQSLAIVRRCGREAYILKPDWARGEDYRGIVEAYPDVFETPVDTSGLPQLAYIYDDLYRHLMDCVVIFARQHPEPIAYTAPAGFGH